MKTKAFNLTLSFLFVSLCLLAQKPNADFTFNKTNECSPVIVNFQDKSTGKPTSWKWDFGNGSTSTKQNPSTSYFKGGTYTVTLTVTNASGSSIPKQSVINVYDGPTVDFTADRTTSCAPGRIQFSDRSTPSPGTTNTTWFWDFGDGTSSTEQNPYHVYRSTGQFTVFLKITNDKGCYKMLSKSNFITVTSGITMGFTNSAPTVCHAPTSINFTNSSNGPGSLSYTWLFGDDDSANTRNTSHIYNKDSSYTVSLVVRSTSGCVDTLTKTNAVVIGGMKSDFTVSDTLCGGNSVAFKNSSLPAPSSSRWVFPDGTSSTAINAAKILAPGTHSIKLVNQFGSCKDSTIKDIVVSAKPVINFTSDDTVKCSAPSTVNFRNETNEGVSYIWLFGNGDSSRISNPTYTYKDSGIYNVKLIATNLAGCVDSLLKTSFIKIKKPVIIFKNLPVRGCLPYTLSPTVDIRSVDKVLTYEWNFGDGNTSTQQFPTHTYTTQGNFTVTLTITTSTGCRETITLPGAVRVGTKPTANFKASTDNTCASGPVQFTNLSSTTDEYYWEFGEGGTSRVKSPTYTFVDTGKMIVSMTAYNSGCGDKITATTPIHVKPPISGFNFRPNCDKRLEFTFTDKSIGAESWKWNFGDGSPEVFGPSPAPHTFPDTTSYNVSLTTTNGACTYTHRQTVRIVNQTPNFTASVVEGCKNLKSQFTPSSPVQLSAVFWDFGDGGKDNNWNPTHTFTKSDSFSVKLIATDTYGCKDSITKPKLIKVIGPTASFGSLTNNGCKGLTTSFLDSSKTYRNNAIVKWQWAFGDGTGQSSNQNPSYKYDTIGTFHVKLVVQDAAGCMDSLTRNNFVKVSTIKASWDAIRESCPKANITFNNTTSGTFTNTWDFGNGVTNTTKSPVYAYTDTGYYTIKLKVRETTSGCEDSLIRQNHVRIGKPVADFTANNLISYCVPFEARFTNTSKYFTSLAWTIQKSPSTVANPVSYYTKTISDPVRLIVTSPGGCKDTITKTLQVKNASDGKITYDPLRACAPAAINFEAFEPINAKFTWDFGDGNIIDTSANKIAHTYTDFGKFIPKVILEEQCIIPLTGKDTLRINGVDAKFGIRKVIFCDTGTVFISDSSTYYPETTKVNYKWSFGDGTFAFDKDPVHYYKQTGSYPVRLDASTTEGCSDSAFFLSVKVAQTPRIAISGDTSICLNERVQYTGRFTLVDTSAVNWTWEFPNKQKTSSLQNPELQLYTAEGNYRVKAMVVSSSQCADSAFLPLHVFPIPSVSVPPSLTTFAGNTLTIPATYSQGVTAYSWTPAQGLSCANCPQPIATPKISTKYTVTATDKNGCQNTGSVHVAVTCPSVNIFVPNTFSPNGDGRNDIFYVRGKGIERVKSLRVFNRWGEIVFEKREIPANIESVQYGWNGKNKTGTPHPDVYIYQVEVYCENGEVLHFEGNVALIQ